MTPSRTHRFIAAFVDWRWPLLVLAVVLAALAWFPAQRVSFDRSIENMFSPRDPVMGPFRQFKEIFGSQEVLLAVYEDPELLVADGQGLDRLKEINGRLRKIPGISDVLSLAEINKLVALISGSPGKSVILSDTNDLAFAYRELFEGYTHSHDGQIAALVCMVDPSQVRGAADPQRKIVDDVRAELRDLPAGLAPGMVAGEPVMVVDGFRLVEEDGQRLGLWSTVLMSLTLAICFRSLRWLLAPLAVVQFSVLLTKALLALLSLKLTLVSSMLTALVTVVGVATVTHLIVGFYEQRSEGKSARESLVNAATLLAWPILGAIATDMVGFGSLWWSSVGPVVDFGTMMVLGSMLVIPAIIMIVPTLALTGHSTTPIAPRKVSSRLRRSLSYIVATVSARPALVSGVAIMAAIVAILGSLRLTVETDFTKNFREESELVRSYNLIESRLGGGGVWDVIVPAPETLDQAYLDRVLKLEQRLRAIRRQGEDTTQPALTKVISLADAIEASRKHPLLGLMAPELRAKGMKEAMPNFVDALRSQDAQGQWWLRIMLRSPERLPAEWKKQTVEEVRRAVAEEFPGDVVARSVDRPQQTSDEPAGVVTGYHVLVIALVDSLLRDQWMMFLLSCLGIATMMLIAFRSFTLAVLCLVPNVLPVLLVTGLMGWLGIRVNMGAAMIAAVSMGLSVDSSIHYITAFRRGIRQGRTVPQALDDVQQTIGSAMFFSTIAILVGFGVLCRSDFIPTIYFGALAGLTMLGGLAGNLVVLPLLLLWTTPAAAVKQSQRELMAR